MAEPIQPLPPVNTLVTIQPVTVAAASHESGAGPNNPLANLASGTTVEGFVINRDAQNNPVVRTALGDLRVTSDVFLKTGSEIVFKVDASQASLARIISVDGLTPQDYSAQNTHGITRDTIATSNLQPLLNQNITQTGKIPGQPAPVLSAVVLQTTVPQTAVNPALMLPPNTPLQLVAQLAQLSAGTPLRLTVLDLKLPPLPVALSTVPDNAKLDSLLPQRPNAAPQLPSAANPQPATTQNNPVGNQQQPVTAALLQNSPEATNPTATISKAAVAIPVAANSNNPTAAPLMAQTLASQMPSSAAPQASAQQHAMTSAQQTAMLASAAKTMAQQPTAAASNTPSQQQPIPASVLESFSQAPAAKSELIANYGKTNFSAPNQPAAQMPVARPMTDASQNAGPTLTASVIGHEADGANILHTPFATLKLYTSQPLPTGTTLTVQAALANPEAHAPAAPVSKEQAALILSNTSRPLQSLEEAVKFVRATNPEIAQEMTQRLPTLNTNALTSNLLFFMAAVKSGDVEEMLGKRALRLLEVSAPGLLSKLRKDIGEIRANFTESPLSHWSVAQLPLMFGTQIEQARLYISKDPEKESQDQAKDAKGQRFILEVGMAQLGQLQLDGFVRHNERRKSFDLVVRSMEALEPQVTQGINEIFYNSMQIAGMNGQLLFQAGGQHFFNPVTDLKPQASVATDKTILA